MFQARRPRPPLDSCVTVLWTVTATPGPRRLERVLPTGTAQIVINLAEDRTRGYDEARGFAAAESSGSAAVRPQHPLRHHRHRRAIRRRGRLHRTWRPAVAPGAACGGVRGDRRAARRLVGRTRNRSPAHLPARGSYGRRPPRRARSGAPRALARSVAASCRRMRAPRLRAPPGRHDGGRRRRRSRRKRTPPHRPLHCPGRPHAEAVLSRAPLPARDCPCPPRSRRGLGRDCGRLRLLGPAAPDPRVPRLRRTAARRRTSTTARPTAITSGSCTRTARLSTDDLGVTADLSHWAGVPRPERVVLDGRYARLEPLTIEQHEADLFDSARRTRRGSAFCVPVG